QVRLAIEECDLVLCVVDGTTDPTPADREAINLLRRADKPVLYVANKIDTGKQAPLANTYYELGIDHLFMVSALHGQGLSALEDALLGALPKPEEPLDQILGEGAPRIALVGRPNAGKSSLTNRLLGEDRLLVDNRPGTTVDSIDTLVHHHGKEFVLIDTAGMRRKRSVERGVEGL